jgi:hypothetical protein
MNCPAEPPLGHKPRRRASIQFDCHSWNEEYKDAPKEQNREKRPPRRRRSIQFAQEDKEYNIEPENQVQERRLARRRRSIQFAQVDEVQEVEPMKNLTHEPENLWYQPDEIRSIQAKNRQLVEKKQNGCETLTRKLCTRGLESSFTPGKRSMKQRKIWESIKDLQAFQRKRGIYDDEIISRVYQRSSADDMREAAQRALEDAQHILKQGSNRPSRRKSIA